MAVLVVLAALLPGVAAAASPDKARTCTACHGQDGVSTSPLVPNLAGQSALYMAKQLQAFRNGDRRNEVMRIVAGKLSDEDIRALAAYYEGLPPCRR